jgi:putative acetyltransferase
MKFCKLFVSFFVVASFAIAHTYEIKPIAQDDLQAARTIIYNAVFELQIIPSANVEEVMQNVTATNSLPDMTDMISIEQTYTNNHGCFLVVVKDDIVVGIGAIKKLNDQRCELTRMFFAPEYRGQGLGSQLMHQLLLLASALEYTTMQLNIWNPVTQTEAICFYKKFGFYEIEPYKNCAGKIFMEKIL